MLGAGRRSPEPTIWLNKGTMTRLATISPCTITMDHDAIICLMTDRLTAVQIKMFTSRAWAATSALLDVFCYLLYRWEKLVSYRR